MITIGRRGRILPGDFVKTLFIKKTCVGEGGELERALDDGFGHVWDLDTIMLLKAN